MVSLYADSYKRMIETLIRARKDAGVTQQQLAERLGQRQTFVSKVETGERRIDVAEFVAMSRAIGADPYKLLKAAERD